MLGVVVDPADPTTVLAEERRARHPVGPDRPRRRHRRRWSTALDAGGSGPVGLGHPRAHRRRRRLPLRRQPARRHRPRRRRGRAGAASAGRSRRTTTPPAPPTPSSGAAPAPGTPTGSCSRSAPASAAAWSSDGRVRHGANGFAGEPGHMLIDPGGPAVPVRARGLLGALRLRLGPRAARSRRRPGRSPAGCGRPGRRRPGGRAGRARRGRRAGGRRRRLAGARRVRVVGGGRHRQPRRPARPRGGRARRRGHRGRGRPARTASRRATPDQVLAHGHRPSVPIVAAHFGERAGAIGAAVLALDGFRARSARTPPGSRSTPPRSPRSRGSRRTCGARGPCRP